jgi:hypothetical protein
MTYYANIYLDGLSKTTKTTMTNVVFKFETVTPAPVGSRKTVH